MKIQNIGGLYIIRGHYGGHYFTASGFSFNEVIASLGREIAIYRSLKAWQ